jgi:bacterioferritin (cytochrome b1)
METDGNTRLIAALNRMLAKEHSCAIRYATYAALVSGPFVDSVSARFQEIASDEAAHAGLLRKRIRGLGGVPTMEVDGGRHRPDVTLSDMVDTSVLEEREAIEDYGAILETIPKMNILLYRTLEDILKDEHEHLEEVLRLDPRMEGIASRSRHRVPLEDPADGDSRQPGSMAPLESRD